MLGGSCAAAMTSLSIRTDNSNAQLTASDKREELSEAAGNADIDQAPLRQTAGLGLRAGDQCLPSMVMVSPRRRRRETHQWVFGLAHKDHASYNSCLYLG